MEPHFSFLFFLHYVGFQESTPKIKVRLMHDFGLSHFHLHECHLKTSQKLIVVQSLVEWQTPAMFAAAVFLTPELV